MKKNIVITLPLLAALALAGCRTSRYTLEEPLDGQSVEVKSGDRISVVVEEDALRGLRWIASCDDPDISFSRETTEPDRTDPLGTPPKVRLIARVARGFDGPAHVRYVYREPHKRGKIVRKIDLIFYHIAEDQAPWK